MSSGASWDLPDDNSVMGTMTTFSRTIFKDFQGEQRGWHFSLVAAPALWEGAWGWRLPEPSPAGTQGTVLTVTFKCSCARCPQCRPGGPQPHSPAFSVTTA